MSKLALRLISSLLLTANIALASINANSATIPHPFFFTENKGQWDSHVLYKCNARNGMTWFLERDGVTLLTCIEDKTQPALPDPGTADLSSSSFRGTADLPVCMQKHPPRYPIKSHALKFKFLATGYQSPVTSNKPTDSSFNRQPGTGDRQPAVAQSIEPYNELPWHNNYFLGNDSTKWAPNCRNFTNITYRDVWDGIDIEWYEENGKLEFDFVVQPGADPSQIRMSCDGLEGDLSVNGRGGSGTARGSFANDPYPSSTTGAELRLPTSLGELRTALPQVYQISSGGSRSEVDAKFEITNKNEFGINLPNGYQKEHTLRIDPLIYSTFLGGSSGDEGNCILNDGNGGVIIAGATLSVNYPTTIGAYDTSLFASSDCYITHLNNNGTQLLYSTFVGGSGDEVASAICRDGNEGTLITGLTISTNFPITTGAYQTSNHGDYDCFVSRINSTGTLLVYSTYLGGSNTDWGLGITPDGDGGVYLAGSTFSNNFPLTSVVSYNGGYDGFIAELNNSGTQLLYSNYFGGPSDDYINGIICDSIGSFVVVGYTNSHNVAPSLRFPVTSGAYDTIWNGGYDGFIARLSNNGIYYCTYLGGASDEYISSVASDSNGGVFVTGQTGSNNFPITTGVYDSSYNGVGTFITHINRNGSQLEYSTFLAVGVGNSIINDGNGEVIVTGGAGASFPTTLSATDTSYNGGWDCFVAKLNNIGSCLLYGTYLGGTNNEKGYGIVRGEDGSVTIVGTTYSSDFPTTPSSFDTSFNRGGDNSFDCFISKISFDTTNVETSREVIPADFTLYQNYPNPFNSTTTISYSLPKAGITELKIFDLLGREVTTLVNRKQSAGSYRVNFDGKNLSSGTYFIRMKSGDFVKTQKMVLLK